jgi:TatD DNase family protein
VFGVYFDTHCHLDFESFGADRKQVVARARDLGVTNLFVPGVSQRRWAEQVRALSRIEGICVGFGVHPYWAREVPSARNELPQKLEAALKAHGAVAIGECGLDAPFAKREGVSLDVQEAVLRPQLELAQRLELPVVLHCVRAHGRLLECLERLGPLPAGGVMHAYSGSPELVQRYARLGMYFGFGGAATRPRAKRAKAALECVPGERLVLETDAPDQPPPWLQGQRNEPAEIIAIAAKLAQLTGSSPEELAERTRQNGRRLFGLA